MQVAEGEFKGAYAYKEYSADQGGIVLKPAPQVGFLKQGTSDYDYYLLDNLPTKQELEQKGYDLKQPHSIRIPSDDVGPVLKLLQEKDIDFKFTRETPQPNHTANWLLKLEGRIDDIILRAVAKIGFNYLAYWQGRHFVLHEGFNPTRNFIRYGKKTSFPLVRIRQESILSNEPIEGKRRSGHLITVDWAADKISIVAQVSLMNWLTYNICLARQFSGEHRVIRRGHFFDPHAQAILELSVREKAENSS